MHDTNTTDIQHKIVSVKLKGRSRGLLTDRLPRAFQKVGFVFNVLLLFPIF